MAWRRTVSADDATAQRLRRRSDPEKARLTDDDEIDDEEDDHSFSPASARSTASSNQPMLAKAFQNTRSRSSLMLRSPRSIVRNVCLGLAFAMVMFVLLLIHMSYRSEKQIQVAIQQEKITPKPPVWEDFPFLKRYYGGIRSLIPKSENVPEYPGEPDEQEEAFNVTQAAKRAIPESVVFNPYPDYASNEYVQTYGKKVDCYLDEAGTVQIPRVRMYEAVPKGFPDNAMGSPELLGLRNDICYDRFGRLGPYGLGYSLNKGGSGAMLEGDRDGADDVWSEYPEVDFRSVKWADVQERCFEANTHRFNVSKKTPTSNDAAATDSVSPYLGPQGGDKSSEPGSGSLKLPRNVVVIRTWTDYPYTIEDIMYLRSIISELSILSGGEYTVHFLIQVKDENLPIFSDEETKDRVLRDSLPEEFRGMGTLWNEKQMLLMYGGLEETMMRGLPVHGVYRSTFMPMQWFAQQHPEFDFFWNWELDARNTGHWYHLFDSASKWAKEQPRKYLWERNSRFYIPSEHGSWEAFSHMVRVQTEQGTNSVNNIWSGLGTGKGEPGEAKTKNSGDRPIWGPERPINDPDTAFSTDPEPPTTFEKDKYTWGVGEDADLITFNPLFDPDGTTWLLAEDTTGFNREDGLPPRRTAIITASRLSRKLLMTMHRETAINKHTMFSEMWPASCALHHGLKAVYVPHPTYVDRRWPTKYMEAVFNAGRNGATGGARTSVFGEPEHNFRGFTWYYNAGFPEALWHRWIGLKIHNDGGEMWEMAGEGRMCLPGMMIHPVKRVELPQEGKRAD